MAIQNSWNNTLQGNIAVSLGSDAAGDLYYYDGSKLARLGIGIGGQILTIASGLPSWQTGAAPSGSAGGDLTGTYPNPTIANSAVTFAKMQAIATNTFLGRVSAGSGNVENLTQTQARTLLGLGSAAYLNAGTGANQVLQLDSSGLVPTTVIPSFALSSIQVVANQAARLALSNVEVGDVAKQSDNGLAYMLSALPASTDANWISIGDTTIVASDIVSGTIDVARLGSGTANSTTYLRGDQTWAAMPFVPLPLTDATSTTQALTVNNRYFANNASRVTCTLPTTAAVGSEISLVGVGAGGWRVAQNTGQSIVFGNKTTTSGVSGRIDSTQQRDTIHLICTVANTTWQVVHAVGNLDVI